MQTPKPIIFFDGLCHLCNGFVDQVLQQDLQAHFQFAPLQGETAKKVLTPEECKALESVILVESEKKYKGSEAVLRVLTKLGGVYSFFALGYLVPLFIREKIYHWVAKNRYSWFGKREFCRRPLPHEKERLLP